MKSAYKNMRNCVKTFPHLLSDMSPKLKDIAERMLPYDTGIEIECLPLDQYVQICDISQEFKAIFRRIPNIKDVSIDYGELRFRIPSGIKGMICLFNICENLKKYAKLNPQSGIHYHIDFTDIWENENLTKYGEVTDSFIEENQQWILNSLKSWNYKGTYNEWKVSRSKKAVKFHEYYKTMEVRIGEMTFDYSLMIKRIVHCQNIARRLKYLLSLKSPQLKQKKDESAKTTTRRARRRLFENATTEW